MTKKSEETTKKLERLNLVIGLETKKTNKKAKAIKNSTTFKTSEVAILLIITTIVSLIMGSAITYKTAGFSHGQKVDDELQEFIQNYDYIIDNYNGTIDKEKMLDTALEAMLGTLDKNSTYLKQGENDNFDIYLEGNYNGLGIQIYNDEDKNIVVYQVFDNSPAAKAGMKPGAIITKLNGKSVQGQSTEEFVAAVKKYADQEIKLTYLQNNQENTMTVSMDKIDLKSVSSKLYTKEGQKIGYLAVGIFASNTYEQFKEALTKLEQKNLDSLIIDLRANSGGYLSTAEEMISLFLDSSHIIYQIKQDDKITKYYSKGKETKNYKIVMLVDSNSASASEIMTSALKEQYGATIVGQKTYGKGSVQELQTLTNGDKYKLTTKNWLTSKGKLIDGKGLEPDVEVVFDPKYYDDPKDENDTQLQKALEEALK